MCVCVRDVCALFSKEEEILLFMLRESEPCMKPISLRILNWVTLADLCLRILPPLQPDQHRVLRPAFFGADGTSQLHLWSFSKAASVVSTRVRHFSLLLSLSLYLQHLSRIGNQQLHRRSSCVCCCYVTQWHSLHLPEQTRPEMQMFYALDVVIYVARWAHGL